MYFSKNEKNIERTFIIVISILAICMMYNIGI